MITINNLSKSYGTRVLFDNLSFSVGKGEKIGLVGRNGYGKTTLLKMITGEAEYDSGEIQIPKNYKIGYLKQHLDFKYKTIIEEVASVLPKEETDNTWKAEKVLFGLGFTKEDLQKEPSVFSGGYKIRLNLAKILLSDVDMLLLDEPNNYLDIVAIRWLIKFLKTLKGELILITHDRSFMDQVVTHTVAIHRNKARKVEGNTEKLYEQIAKEEEIYEKTRINIEKRRKRTELFIRRFRAKARLAGMVQSRIKTLEKQEDLKQLTELETLDFSFSNLDFPANKMLSTYSLKFGYTDNDILIDNLNLDVLKKERICVIGKNGKGKSTLLKLLAGRLNPISGNIKKHPELEIGYFVQSDVAQLNDEDTIYDSILSANTKLPQNARNICGAMMFGGNDMMKRIKVLSGGEKSRVLLGKILAKPAHLLLLDEPTNHLDLESTESLIDAINEFSGSIIIVTHNEELLHAVAQKLIIFDRNKVSFFDGTYADFLERCGWEDESSEIKAANKNTEKKLYTKEEVKKIRAKLIQEKSRALKPLELKIKELEKEIQEKESEIENITKLLVKACEENDLNYMAEGPKQSKLLKENLEILYNELLENTEIFEEKEKYYEKEFNNITN
ncbi:ABC-F family ATP-binding cassette domain-containing protein [Candidatus Ruminimicrobiellum ovillum]|uniref:ABC-F family ATP-binding cassette domain-containing protein n=1 Tax=Candidatus Ruminimicrobiellum ovillum TaxID=1947927 RepID=UPI00355A92D7